MSTTVFEALQNAEHNLNTLGSMGVDRNPFFKIAMEQLTNAIQALDNGLKPNDVIQENMLSEVDTGD